MDRMFTAREPEIASVTANAVNLHPHLQPVNIKVLVEADTLNVPTAHFHVEM